MKMSWHRVYTKEGAVVHIVLEIDETEFVAARLNGLSGDSKISDRLLWFAKMAEDQEAIEAEPFEEHIQQLQRAMMIYSGDGLHNLNEMRKLHGLYKAIQKEKDSGNNTTTESINKGRV